MNDFVKQYSSRIEKHLNLQIRLLLQEQKQSDEELHFTHNGLSQYSDYHTVSNPDIFVIYKNLP